MRFPLTGGTYGGGCTPSWERLTILCGSNVPQLLLQIDLHHTGTLHHPIRKV